MSGPVAKEEIARKLKLDYQFCQEDPTARVLDALKNLFTKWGKKEDRSVILTEAANILYRHFKIREIGVGLRDPDGLFRMNVFVGYRDDAITANRKLAYSEADFGESGVYKGTLISNLTKAYLAEDNPYANGEQGTYNRPMLLKGRRMAVDESIEGDYFDTRICAPDGKLLGWIEYSGTTAGRLPNATSIKWIELEASIIGSYLSR